MIEAHAIVKRFGRVLAVDRVSFTVPARSVCGFLGPNGAGKSTSIRMIVGAMAPDEGEVRVGGQRMEPGADAVRRTVGYLPEESPVTPDLTVDEFVRFRAELWGVPRAGRGAAVDRALARCNVADVRRRLCGQLSKGYRQRVGMAAAIVHSPAVLVLDEPTSGLDPAQVRDFRSLVRSLAEESTVLLSSHVLAEVEASCDRAVLIDRGRVVADGSMADLRARGASGAMVVVECARDASAAIAGIAGVRAAPVAACADGWCTHELALEPSADADRACEAVARALAGAGIALRRLERAEPPLEAVFHRLIAGAGGRP
jgi:ABC-2 type transport system ATP-binding protein